MRKMERVIGSSSTNSTVLEWLLCIEWLTDFWCFFFIALYGKQLAAFAAPDNSLQFTMLEPQKSKMILGLLYCKLYFFQIELQAVFCTIA